MDNFDDFKDEAALWDVYAQLMAVRGVNLNKLAATWPEQEKKKLTNPVARLEFEELCDKGCASAVLAFILVVMRFSPELPALWSHIAGTREQRRKVGLLFQRTAQKVEDTFSDWIKADVKMPHYLTAKGIVPPPTVAASLRFYSRFLNLEESLTSGEIRSSEEVVKYLLTSYIKKATGRFRDRNAATLIGEIVGQVDYNEVAQRMWRSRNYARLDKNIAGLTGFLFAMGVVIDARVRNITNS
ncbi:MAG TPA: hypothetical protein VFK06_18220 [Candidatus Angelobacter sp.]|nr:hypothetical protein [Candidatus Angelobacter sp.]